MLFKDVFIRNIEATSYRENFLVSALVSIFFIRVYLRIAHYPTIGSGEFHIAHLLWGGFFMMLALLVLLSFLNEKAAVVASILGGIGFGSFIDELGKFITSDNNYFYQPTIALIYIIFVLLYLISRFIPRYQPYSQREYLVNAIEMIKESAVNDFDEEEERRATEYLKKCDPKNPIVKDLKKLILQLEVEENPPPGIFTKIRRFFRQQYYVIAQSGTVVNTVIVLLVISTGLTITQIATLSSHKPLISFSEWGQLYSSILCGIFVLIGLFALRFSRSEAYRFFRIAVLVNLLLTQFFILMHLVWYDIFGLALNLFALLVINYAMARDSKRSKSHNVVFA
ncbi:MAG TPA: hypothetical protein VLF93_04080 [Candidatus Saccharimonadales bacterium]|nr:hypothetical protein [Candidatus Saccharimonadales bacterium]